MNDLILKMQKDALENHIPIMDEEGLKYMQAYILGHQVKTILELGSAIGYSAIQMARLNPDIKVVTIERDQNRYEEAINNIQLTKLTSQIKIHLVDALEFSTDEKFDLIFIDAAKAQYIKFFERYKHNLNEQGSIISDNLKFHGFVETSERIKNRNTRQLVGKIRKYIDFLKENEEYETTFIDKGDGIAISKKKVL